MGVPDIWTAGGKTFLNLIMWVHEHLLTFLTCNYRSNSRIPVHVKFGFSVDSKISQIVQCCEKHTNRAARGNFFWNWRYTRFCTPVQIFKKVIHQFTKIRAFSRIVKLCVNSRVILSGSLFLKLGNFQRHARLVDTTFAPCRQVPPHHHPASKVVLENLLRVLATLLVFLPPLSGAYSGR